MVGSRCSVDDAKTPQTQLQESVPAAAAPAISSFLSFQVGVIVVAALYLARDVLVPITLAILAFGSYSPLGPFAPTMSTGSSTFGADCRSRRDRHHRWDRYSHRLPGRTIGPPGAPSMRPRSRRRSTQHDTTWSTRRQACLNAWVTTRSLRRRLLRRRPTNRLLVSSPAQKQQLRVR